jgi:hypothetical protein
MIETDRYTFDDSTGLTADAIEKVIAGIKADYGEITPDVLETYVNNRIKNTTGKTALFVLKEATEFRNDEDVRTSAIEKVNRKNEEKLAEERKAKRVASLAAFRKVSMDRQKEIEARFAGADRAAIQKALDDARAGLKSIATREKEFLKQIAAEKEPLDKVVSDAEAALADGTPGGWPFSRFLWNAVHAPKSKWKYKTTDDVHDERPEREHEFVKTIKGGDIKSITFTVYQRLDAAGFFIVTDWDHVGISTKYDLTKEDDHVMDELGDTREGIFDVLDDDTVDEEEEDVIRLPVDKIHDLVDLMFINADSIDEKWKHQFAC